MNEKLIRRVDSKISSVPKIAENDTAIEIQIKSDLFDEQERITDKFIKMSYYELYSMIIAALNTALECVKKVNLKRPFKQNPVSRFFKFDIEADLLSSTTLLYTSLSDMIDFLPFFDSMFEALDEIQKDINNMIKGNNFSDATVFNKAIALSQLESLRQCRLSLLTVFDCYRTLLKSPQIISFYKTWTDYKEKTNRQLVLKFNDEKKKIIYKEDSNKIRLKKLENL